MWRRFLGMKRAFLGWAVWLLLVVACHSGTGGSGSASISVTGTIGGEGFEFIDVGGWASQGVITGGPFAGVTIAATSKLGACGAADQSNLSRANLTSFFILITDTGGTSPAAPIAPGTFAFGSMQIGADAGVTETVNASIGSTDAMCQPIGFNGIQASGGSVTLTSITASEIDGSFDFTFYNMGELKGSFRAPVCTNVAAGREAGACRP
jgi:hypothetical protein